MKTPMLNLKALELIGELQTEFDRETYLDIQKCVDDIQMKDQFHKKDPTLDFDFMQKMKIMIKKKDKVFFQLMNEKIDFDNIDASFKKEMIE